MQERKQKLIYVSEFSEVLEQLLNLTISDDPEDEKKRLMNLSKDEIIEDLLAAKVKLFLFFISFRYTNPTSQTQTQAH